MQVVNRACEGDPLLTRVCQARESPARLKPALGDHQQARVFGEQDEAERRGPFKDTSAS